MTAKFVIHTVGPVWNSGTKNEKEKLQNCYVNALKIAVVNNCKSIAFPSIRTGIYRFPKDIAAKIAISSILGFLEKTNPIEKIILVCFDDDNYHKLQAEFSNYIPNIKKRVLSIEINYLYD